MSIQNRLLLVYALIFSVVYFLSSLVVYILPRNQILAQIDGDLYSLASQLESSSTEVGDDGIIRVPLPEDLATLETALNNQKKPVAAPERPAGQPAIAGPIGVTCP